MAGLLEQVMALATLPEFVAELDLRLTAERERRHLTPGREMCLQGSGCGGRGKTRGGHLGLCHVRGDLGGVILGE